MAAIIFVWFLAALLVWPAENFPVYDDWAYAEGVRNLVELGEIKFSDWAAPNQISHTLWGALFAVPLGTGYLSLRLATLTAALLSSLCLYRLLREVATPIATALLATFAVMFHPATFFLSFSFMTDVSYAAAQTVAMALLLAGLRARLIHASAIGWSVGLAALLCRQTGFAIPVGHAGAFLAEKGVRIRHVMITALPIAAFILVQAAYQFWLHASGRTPAQFGAINGGAPANALSVFSTLIVTTGECGLALLPISVLIVATFLARAERGRRLRFFAIAFVLTVCLLVLARISGGALYRTIVIGGLHTGAGSAIIGAGSALLSALASSLFLCAVFLSVRAALREKAEAVLPALALACLALFALLAILCSLGVQYDRYFIPVISLAAVIVCAGRGFGLPPRRAVWLAAVLLVVMADQTLIKTHNFFTLERARLAAVQDLVRQGVPRENIDAGWMLNGADNFGRFGDKADLYSWYAVREYVVDPVPEPGYRVISRYTAPLAATLYSRSADVLVQYRESTVAPTLPR